MGRTDTVTPVITLTEDALDPYVTHVPTRRWLTGPGLPVDGGLLTFDAVRTEGLRTVGDSTGDPGRLAARLRDQLVIGGILGADGRERESVLLDGLTGAVSTTHFLHDRPDLMRTRPLAPSLGTLVRFATAADELAALRGQFASYAGRFGPDAVAEATNQLLAIFGTDPQGRPAPFWTITAVIRPLALVAGPGTRSELALDLPPRLLDDAFGAAAIVRFEEVDFPAALTHEPTRRFLREVGLPEDGVWFGGNTEVQLPTLAEYHEADCAPATAPLPPTADRLIRLGRLVEDTSLVVDGDTGAVLSWGERDAALRPLNADVSTLAFTLWLVHQERSLDAIHELTDAYDQLADTMTRTLSAVDPVACAPGRRHWPTAFAAGVGGGPAPGALKTTWSA
ncbi:SUKH-4 family immunity protein [Streptomyces longwoodensis]|uniref:SUKH-4 family immunity protein n=1 Tax=Streptomyces longwoodensis TaxID=68231 RepID=UPI0036E25116